MIRVLSPRGPYFLAGHSLGGLIAMEIAQLLAQAGEQVALLAMLDTYLPARATAKAERVTRPSGPPIADRASTAPAEATASEPRHGSRLERGRAALRGLRSALEGRLRTERLVKLSRLPLAGVIRYPGLLQYDVFFDQGRVIERLYRPRPWSGRTLLARARDNPDPHDAWAGLVPHSRVLPIDCEHFSMLRDPHVGEIAAQLTREIDALLAAQPRT